MTSEAPIFGVPASGPVESERLAAAIENAGGRVRVLEGDQQPGERVEQSAERAEQPVDDDGRSVGDAGAPETGGLDALLTVGHEGLARVADRGPDAPVLPVDAGAGLPSVPLAALEDAVRSIVAGDARTEAAPLLDVAVDGSRTATVYREATLLTEAPAHISEYAIEHDAVGSIDVVRADGVVIATPAGSRGYAAAGDGPLCFPGTGLAVVPVAPFRTDRDRWVVPRGRLTVRVQRDGAAVAVEGDGEHLGTIGRGSGVTFAPAGELAVLVVDASERGGR